MYVEVEFHTPHVLCPKIYSASWLHSSIRHGCPSFSPSHSKFRNQKWTELGIHWIHWKCWKCWPFPEIVLKLPPPSPHQSSCWRQWDQPFLDLQSSGLVWPRGVRSSTMDSWRKKTEMRWTKMAQNASLRWLKDGSNRVPACSSMFQCQKKKSRKCLEPRIFSRITFQSSPFVGSRTYSCAQ